MEHVPERARRVLVRLYSLDEAGGDKKDLQYPSGISFCLEQGWAVQDAHANYSITAAGRAARESLSDFVFQNLTQTESSADLPLGPYSVAESGEFVYIVDAAGQKIATLLGTRGRKIALAKLICSARQLQNNRPKGESA